MASKKNYSRFFIILQEDDKEYGISAGKTPTGYAKIEIKNSKCRVSYYVQNLKLNEKYCMVIICGKNGEHKLINIGNMVLDEQGRIDTSYEYDIDNIAGTSISYDKIIGAAVVKKNQRSIVSIMSGFMTCNVPDNWKDYKLIDAKSSNDEENIFEKYEKSIEESKNTQIRLEEDKNNNDNKLRDEEVEIKVDNQKISNNTISDKKVVNQEIKNEDINNKETNNKETKTKKVINQDVKNEDINNMEVQKESNENNEDINNMEAQKESNENNEDSQNDSIKCNVNKIYDKEQDDNYRSNMMNSSEKFFMSLVEEHEELFDIIYNIKNCRWFKINVTDFDNLCNMSNYDKYVVINYPMISYYQYIKRYGHFLIGYKYDKNNNIKYIIYAIPGSKLAKYQPYQGKTGFVTWLKCKNNKLANGYWLMFYDYKISKVLIPIKKTKKYYENSNK